MPRKRRKLEVFSLSFLDCICCGFGAVILFYTIISAQSGVLRARETSNLRAQANQLQQQLRSETRNLTRLRNTLQETNAATAADIARVRQLLATLEIRRQQVAQDDASELATRQRVEKLKADLRALEAGARRLQAGSEERAPLGQQVQPGAAIADSQRYLRGLKLSGKHILILLDRSASMLHEDVVQVIVLRNSGTAAQQAATKWQRTLRAARWLINQVPAGSEYQVVGFNIEAQTLLTESNGRWLQANNAAQRAAMLKSLRALQPQQGTSLANAFAITQRLQPRPDQIVLLTDGLPTQGKTKGSRRYIDADNRARLFDDAVGQLIDGVPVDIVLLPMLGDLPAAHRFWQLARLTGGTLLVPSKDWP
jgi:hypothetical protein